MHITCPLLCIVIWAQVLSTTSQETEKPSMPPKKHVPEIPLSLLLIPTLEAMSLALAKDLRTKYYNFATEYSVIFAKHLATETEVTIVDGKLTVENTFTLLQLEAEFEVLQYKNQIHSLAEPWKIRLNGQPNLRGFRSVLDKCVDDIVNKFEKYIFKLQHAALIDMRSKNKQLCTKACSNSSVILNLTDSEIPPELVRKLSSGSNFVPMDHLSSAELRVFVENDLKNAAINFYREEHKVYPLVDQSASLTSVLKQLMSQSPSNSYQLEFYTSMHNNYMENGYQFYEQFEKGHYIESKDALKMTPNGTILTLTDKGLGPCLLPVEWYVQQYKIQAEKGKHAATGLSSDQCINLLKATIQNFRSTLSSDECLTLKQYFVSGNPNYKVGIMKVIPKIHKLTEFDSQAWTKLPSRPIRGAENCPINPYSQTLCKLLQEMHNSLRNELFKTGIKFPLIYGCDEFSDNIQKTKFGRSTWSTKTLVSGDFSDAYTKSNLADLQGSISKLGILARWSEHKMSLARKLAKLVFENCYFETPSGILRQTQGFPMGGHCSREGLDNILLSREIDILSSPVSKNLLFYQRMVDDISTAVDGGFMVVKSLLDKLAQFYPNSMPLNIQISFGYSHFLDSHVYNILQEDQVSQFTTSLSYKPLSKFDYVPFNSNIAPEYKGKNKSFIII